MAIGDIPEPRVFDSLKQAWHNIWPSFWVLLGMFILIMILETPSSLSESMGGGAGATLGILGGILTIFLIIPLQIGMVHAHLAVSKGDKAEFSSLKYGFGRYWQSIGVSLLTALIVMVGFVFLIIPGIYLAVKLSQTSYRFVEDELGVIDAIKASWEDTKGHWWPLFGMIFVALGVIILGALALGIGVFVSFVLIGQMTAVYWRAITQ